MNAPAVATATAIETDGWRNIGVTALLLALGLASLGLLFRAETEAAVTVWDASSTYLHCFLIIPIVAYMVWDRREALQGLRPAPVPAAGLLGLLPAMGWLLAERLGTMEGRQWMVIAFAEVLFLAVLGRKLFRAMMGPLLYLFFLVPFGEFLTPWLRDITAVLIRHGLSWAGIPAAIDPYTIMTPQAVFPLAEVSAGLRFLIASAAFGVLYALLMYRSPMRRVVFVVVAIVVPIVANVLRVLGIIVLGHVLGGTAAADHIRYGWVFFSAVILLLTLLGLPFRQDLQRRPWRDAEPEVGMLPMLPGLAAVAAVVAVAAISPTAALGLDRLGSARSMTPLALSAPPGCEIRPLAGVIDRGGWRLSLPMRAQCGSAGYDLVLETFSTHSTAGPIIAERRRITNPTAADSVMERPVDDGDGRDTMWRLVRSINPHQLAAVRLWIDGEPTLADPRMRVRQARASLIGANHAPALLVVRPREELDHAPPEHWRRAERALSAFVQTLPGLDERVRAMTRRPD